MIGQDAPQVGHLGLQFPVPVLELRASRFKHDIICSQSRPVLLKLLHVLLLLESVLARSLGILAALVHRDERPVVLGDGSRGTVGRWRRRIEVKIGTKHAVSAVCGAYLRNRI